MVYWVCEHTKNMQKHAEWSQIDKQSYGKRVVVRNWKAINLMFFFLSRSLSPPLSLFTRHKRNTLCALIPFQTDFKVIFILACMWASWPLDYRVRHFLVNIFYVHRNESEKKSVLVRLYVCDGFISAPKLISMHKKCIQNSGRRLLGNCLFVCARPLTKPMWQWIANEKSIRLRHIALVFCYFARQISGVKTSSNCQILTHD